LLFSLLLTASTSCLVNKDVVATCNDSTHLPSLMSVSATIAMKSCYWNKICWLSRTNKPNHVSVQHWRHVQRTTFCLLTHTDTHTQRQTDRQTDRHVEINTSFLYCKNNINS